MESNLEDIDELLDILGGDYDDMEVKNRLLLCMKNEASHFINFQLMIRCFIY